MKITPSRGASNQFAWQKPYIYVKNHILIYKQQEATSKLKNSIKSFWMIDSENQDRIKKEKIIPDGYPEMIFHYKDPYRANISGTWRMQEKSLIAGQIRNHFYLENTGKIGMFGIKFQPWALRSLLHVDMYQLTDKVMDIDSAMERIVAPIRTIALSQKTFEDRVKDLEHCFHRTLTSSKTEIPKGQKATRLILEKKGKTSIHEILDKVVMTERSLERYFKSHIGLSPKRYSRVIRFSHIFNLVNQKGSDWADVVFLTGFYDQSHFIKNFKEFTGEEPSKYGFETNNMANFFLKK